jgi:hypothetical protein
MGFLWTHIWARRRRPARLIRRDTTTHLRVKVLEDRNLLSTGLGMPTPGAPVGLTASADPTFTWSTVTGADHYDVWANDLTTGQSQVLRNQTVSGTSWTPPTGLVQGQAYDWWVRAVNATGTPGPWSSAQYFTVAALAVPTPQGPSGTVAPTGPTFAWSGVNGASGYDVWVDNLTTGQSQVLRNINVSGTSWTPTGGLGSGYLYEWWVRAVSATGGRSAWSVGQDFSVAWLSVPTPQAPAGTVGQSEPTFYWSAVSGANTYDVWVDDVTTGQSQVLRNTNVSGNSWTPTTPLTVGQDYQWWVRAVSATGIRSAWSAAQPFHVSTPLAAAPLHAAGPVQGFQTAGTPFPAIGSDTKPSVIFTIGPGGTLTTTNTGQPPYDDIEDTYVGVVNESGSGAILNSLTLQGSLDGVGIFEFDGDGIQTFGTPSTYTPPPSAGANYHVTGYEGPGTFYSNISADLTTGNVNFDNGSGVGLQPGQQTFFSFEEAPTAINTGATKVNLVIVGATGPRPVFFPILNYNPATNSFTGTLTVANLSNTAFSGNLSFVFSTTTTVNDGTGDPHPFTLGSSIDLLGGTGFDSHGHVFSTVNRTIPANGSIQVTFSFSAGPLRGSALSAFVVPGFNVSIFIGSPP